MLNISADAMSASRNEQIWNYFFHYIWILTLGFGLTSNSVNMMIFAKIGLRENVTITLFFLSLSDLVHLVLFCPSTAARMIVQEKPNYAWPFDPMILVAGTKVYSSLFYDYSSFVSVFLAVVRCLCVAKPLEFKSMITKVRTLFCLISLFLISVAIRAPSFTVFRMARVRNPKTNSSFMKLVISSDYYRVNQASDILNENIVPWLAYTTVVVCVVILLHKLREAAKFRQSLANTGTEQNDGASSNRKTGSKGSSASDSVSTSPKRKKTPSEKMSAKDLQVVQSVTLVCIIFILSQLPFQIASVYRLIEPEFDNGGRLNELYQLFSNVKNTCGLLNASINIFVYIKYNSKYRVTLQATFWGTSQEKSS
ncbi:chemosensory receptor c [Plakobranchus ocellatus]|uniref:Chemosensory receptor c n=1 Tax=Plakobranchus ocellatus TaxID=259542 RepID=A0AAV3YSD4_9GAST|nr:chemosensory receptor c [Plakobranchus ocellatus]